MKEQIIESLKQTYSAKYGADDSFISGQADAILATGVTEETMANAVAGVESSFRAYQSFQDKHRAEKARLEKELEELKKASQTTTQVEPPNPNNDGESELLKYLKELREEINGIKSHNEVILKEKTRSQIISEAVSKFDSLKGEGINAGIVEDAKEIVLASVKETDSVDDIVEALKARYNKSASRVGLNNYTHITSSDNGGNKKGNKALLQQAVKNLQAKGQFPKDE